MADFDALTDVVDRSGNGMGVALNVFPFGGNPLVYDTIAAFPIVGNSRFIYVANDTEKTYRWDSTVNGYIEISPAPATPTVFVNDRTALAGLNTVSTTRAILTESGREGLFVFDSSDLSAKVTIDTAQGLYVAPTSAPTGASGAWVRKFDGSVNPLWFGIVEGNAAGANGAANSAAWTVLWTLLQSLAKNIFSTQQSVYSIQFPLGYFEFNSVLELDYGSVILAGVGSGSAEHRGTELKFPAGTTCIRVQKHNTTGAGGVAVANHPGASGSIIRNMTITGGFTGTEAEFHGIHLRARANIEDVFIRDCEGDGIYSDVSVGGSNEGNSNLSFIKSVTVTGCRNALYVDGADVNAWVIIGFNGTSCRQWGTWDSSFLGNTYIGCHWAANGFVDGSSPIGSVSHGGQRYTVIAGQEAGASTNAPSGTATDNTWWKHFGAGGVSAAVPAWLSGTTYRAAGAVRTDNTNAKNVIIGCYRESGQGHSQLVRPTLVLGGVLASSAVTGAGVLDVTSGGVVINYTGLRSTFGTAYSQIGEALAGTLTIWNDSSVAPNSHRWKYSGNEIRFDYANTNPTLHILGPNTTEQLGSGAAAPGYLVGTRFALPSSFGGANSSAKRVCRAAVSSATYAAPAGGATVDTEGRASLAQLAADLADMKAKLQAAGLMS